MKSIALITLGAAVRRRNNIAALRFTAVALSALLMTAALGAIAAAHATYSGSAQRLEARTPATVSASDTRPVVKWFATSDTLEDQRPFGIVYVDPQTNDAPLPPGLEEWPAPGEAILSPALLDAGKGEGIATRYGHLAGTITTAGLADGAEKLAYIRPMAGHEPPHTYRVAGFGEVPRAVSSPGLDPRIDKSKPEWMFQALIAGFALVPALLFLALALRIDATARDRRTTLLTVLGAHRRDRALVVLGEAWLPLVTGAALGGVALAVCAVVDVTIPLVGFPMLSTDIQALGWRLLAVPAVACLVALSVTVGLNSVRALRPANRPQPASARVGRWAALCPVGLLLAVRGPSFFVTSNLLYVVTLWAGVVLTLVTIPSVVALVTMKLGAVLARIGSARGWAGPLVAGRSLQAAPMTFVRAAAGVAIALCVLYQVVAWQGIFSKQAAQALSVRDQVGTSMLVMGSGGSTEQLRDFLAHVPRGTHHLAYREDPLKGEAAIQGTCRALRTLELPCPAPGATRKMDSSPRDERVQELTRGMFSAGGQVLIKQHVDVARLTTAGGEDNRLLLVSADRSDLSAPQLKRIAYHILPTGASIRTPGAEWLSGGEANRDQATWSVVVGLFGIVTMGITAGFSGVSEFMNLSRRLAPLTALAGRRTVYRTASGWIVLTPMLLAGAIGVVAGSWLSSTIVAEGQPIPWSVPIGGILATTGVGVVLWWFGSRAAVRRAEGWRPSSVEG